MHLSTATALIARPVSETINDSSWVEVGIGTGLMGADFAIVRDGDKEYTVELARIRDIKEE